MNIQVEVIVYVEIQGTIQYLLLKRNELKGGFWQPITGGVEADEYILDAVKRELTEETGIIEKNIDFIKDLNYVFYFQENNKLYEERVFAVKLSESPCIYLSDEHVDFKWCTYNEAMMMLKWKDNKNALQLLNDSFY